MPLDTKNELLQPLRDQLNLILTQSKCQMTINFQGSWHCEICQYLLFREFENNERNEMAREHFETVNEKVHLNSSTLAHSVTPQASLLGYHEISYHGSQTQDL